MQEIEEQRIRSLRSFKYRTLPFIIIIAILLFTALYLIYPRVLDFIKILTEYIEEQQLTTPDIHNPKVQVHLIEPHSSLYISLFSYP